MTGFGVTGVAGDTVFTGCAVESAAKTAPSGSEATIITLKAFMVFGFRTRLAEMAYSDRFSFAE